MKNILLILCFLVSLSACDTQQDVIDTGTASPYFDGTMMEFLRADDYNWELTVKMIERAGLTDLFEGRVDTLPEITFWGLKSYSIQRYICDEQMKNGNNIQSVEDISVKDCRNFILHYVSKGKLLKKDIAYRNMDYQIFDERQEGRTVITCLAGNQFYAYLEVSPYGGVADGGAVTLKLYSPVYEKIPMATPDIQPKNGVIHALNYGHAFGKI